jgi:hypothetical protein
MASGHVNRANRPDTWLHRPILQNVKKPLANPEPSKHDPLRAFARTKSRSAATVLWLDLANVLGCHLGSRRCR